MKFRFPIVIIDEDYRSENTSGLGIRALAQAIEAEGFEVLGVTSLQAAHYPGADAAQALFQQADAALTHAGITDVRVLDYSWGKELLRQLVTLRRMGMALAAIAALLWWLACGVRRELRCAGAALRHSYWQEWLPDHAAALLAWGIAALPCLLAVALLARWLWQVEIVLPAGLIPAGSLFDRAHYAAWLERTFPAGHCSAYAAALRQTIVQSLRLGTASGLAFLAWLGWGRCMNTHQKK